MMRTIHSNKLNSAMLHHENSQDSTLGIIYILLGRFITQKNFDVGFRRGPQHNISHW